MVARRASIGVAGLLGHRGARMAQTRQGQSNLAHPSLLAAAPSPENAVQSAGAEGAGAAGGGGCSPGGGGMRGAGPEPGLWLLAGGFPGAPRLGRLT
mmetsp:Transcript_11091/g.26316  ORF Transcript_11091/g.26316 Transcript_11091/m.26316 type:complete len:97 (+) Transcript_11091:223-513(+)